MAVPFERTRRHEHEALDTRHQPRDRFDRLRPLHREQRLLVHQVQRHIVGQHVEQIGEIVIFGRAVDDDIIARLAERMRAVCRQRRHHQIVEDAALVVQQQRIADLGRRQAGDVARQHRFQRLRDRRRIQAVPGQRHLPHVADVEQPDRVAHPQMLGHDAFILDGHFVAGKRHHAAATGAVPGVERQVQDGGFVALVDPIERIKATRPVPRGHTRRHDPSNPLCHGNLRAFAGTAGLPLRWPLEGALSRVSIRPARSVCLRDSGVVAPSAAPFVRGSLPRMPMTVRTAIDKRRSGERGRFSQLRKRPIGPSWVNETTAPSPPSPRTCSGVHRAAGVAPVPPAVPLAAEWSPEHVRGDDGKAVTDRPYRCALYFSWSSVSWKPTSASNVARSTALRTSGLVSGSTAASSSPALRFLVSSSRTDSGSVAAARPIVVDAVPLACARVWPASKCTVTVPLRFAVTAVPPRTIAI
ncbi:hypothetical protein WR25_13303 [Diploscapter pachys]|uniref:Uncharacterized protein n=1 Tax=Diploscapter pachys TaxID=2018661 RepID=A0A2A2M2Q1_9BILA|nr:hypothetical protein WR25_13303 [Diploscapter pachys]